MKTKRCSTCGEIKDVSEFNKHSRTKDGLQPRCRPCQKVGNLKFQEKRKDYKLLTRYGISRKQYNSMAQEQNYLCGICGVKPTASLDVDHNHATGRVRALLCRRCNVTLGSLEEDTELLMKFIRYLRKHNEDI